MFQKMNYVYIMNLSFFLISSRGGSKLKDDYWDGYKLPINPSRPVHLINLYQIKINLNFYFYTSLWCLKMFYEEL